MLFKQIVICVMLGVIACGNFACGVPDSEPPTGDGNMQSGPSAGFLRLTFEERMKIRARLTVIASEAQAAANAIYDKFSSEENAIRNEEYSARIELEKREALMEEHGLTEYDLELIVGEYLQRQGVEIRE